MESDSTSLEQDIPSEKLILGIGAYGRQWITDENGTRTEDLNYSQVIDRAKISKSNIIKSTGVFSCMQFYFQSSHFFLEISK